ncbi:MAG: PQQ-like beta-propeller repeat protein [Gemmataceae bacterium]|nr:PQQ-like beta-propeller repeat protein [Gemmataceae bacterium]
MSDTTSPVPANALSSEAAAPAVIADRAPPTGHAERQPRWWPGVVIVVLQWLLITVPGWVAPGTMTQFFAMFWGPILGAVAFVAWWLCASRLRWADRWLGLLAGAALGAVAFLFYHPSFGHFGLIMRALPVATTAWILWLIATPFLGWPARRVGLLVVFVLAWGYFALVRLDGVDGGMSATYAYRWTPTAEEKFLAEIAAAKPRGKPALGTSTAKPLVLQPGDWPSFRGPHRDGRWTGAHIATDWRQNPPRLVWRHRVGPGWSSFAVVGTHLYTQEQRGEDEVVVCYDTDSGAELWVHHDSARFTEAVAGPGPRATPTFHEGKIYALGAAGRLNCLDAVTGSALWSRDIVADSGAKVPQWGFAASPLVAAGVVTVFAGGPEGKSVLGYHAALGELAWSAGEGQFSYASTHLARLGGVEQLLIVTDAGLTAFHPARGTIFWQHSWPLEGGMARIVQPTLLGDFEVLIGTGFSIGTRRVRVQREGDSWAAQEVWTTHAIKPYFNDLVVHRDHVYGFDGIFFTCVSLEDGKGKWRARGYGNGQVLLLADQELLLILSEKGEAALVEASPNGHKELGRFRALEGKTWNHPVVAHGKLFVRNGEEAACYQLTEASGGSHLGE